MTKTHKINGEFLVLLGAILWGTTGTAQSFANPAAQPEIIGISRTFVGGIALFLLVIQKKKTAGLFQPFGLMLTAAISSLLYQVCFFSAVKLTGVAIGTVVGIGSSPIFAGLLGWFIRKERPGKKWWPATFLSLSGISLVGFSSNSQHVALFGIFLALAAGCSYAILAVTMKTILLKRNDPISVTCGIFLLGGLLTFPVFFFYDLRWLLLADGYPIVLYLGVVTAAIAYYLFNSGLRRVDVATASTLTMGEPMTAGLLGVFVLHEQLSPTGWWGIALLLCGLLLLALPLNRFTNRVQWLSHKM